MRCIQAKPTVRINVFTNFEPFIIHNTVEVKNASECGQCVFIPEPLFYPPKTRAILFLSQEFQGGYSNICH